MIKKKLAQLAAGIRPDLFGRKVDQLAADMGVELLSDERDELKAKLAVSIAGAFDVNLPPELPAELSEIAAAGGHEIQCVSSGEVWLTWGADSNMRRVGDYSVLEALFPDPTIMDLGDGSGLSFPPSPMPSYVIAFEPPGFENEQEKARKFYERAVSAFVSEDTGHVDLGKQHGLIAVTGRLEKRLRITGEMVAEGPLAAIRGILQVWFVETAHRLGKRIKAEALEQIDAEEEIEALWDDAEFLWNDFKIGRCGDELEERLNNLLFRQDTPATLARHTKIGLLHFTEWRDQLLRYAHPLHRKHMICGSMLLSADTGEPVLGWKEMEEELTRGKAYKDESMQTTADGPFSANAVWHRWGRYIVNRVLELEKQGITTRTEQARIISQRLSEDRLQELESHGVTPGDFGPKQLKRVMEFHRDLGFDAS